MVEIKLKNISKTFDNLVALDNISLDIKDQEYFIILGPTGAGKTTLIKVISGLIKPDSGEIYFDNMLIRKDGQFVIDELEGLNPENLI